MTGRTGGPYPGDLHDPSVAWLSDTALVFWKEGQNSLVGLKVSKSGFTSQPIDIGGIKGEVHDPHVFYESGLFNLAWTEENLTDPPPYWIKWGRGVSTIRPPVGITHSITGPIGGDYTVHFTVDKSVKELWFLLSMDGGKTFPDTLLHRIDPPDKDSVKLMMPDYPTRAMRLGVAWKDTSGQFNSMIIPARSVIASSGLYLTHGNNSKKVIAS